MFKVNKTEINKTLYKTERINIYTTDGLIQIQPLHSADVNLFKEKFEFCLADVDLTRNEAKINLNSSKGLRLNREPEPPQPQIPEPKEHIITPLNETRVNRVDIKELCENYSKPLVEQPMKEAVIIIPQMKFYSQSPVVESRRLQEPLTKRILNDFDNFDNNQAKKVQFMNKVEQPVLKSATNTPSIATLLTKRVPPTRSVKSKVVDQENLNQQENGSSIESWNRLGSRSRSFG